ncbi:uncharacterized protein [Nicotiana sylvestris]
MSHPHGSQASVSQPLRSQLSVSRPLAGHTTMSQSQGSQPSSSETPPISGLRLRDTSSDPPTPSTHASDIHVSDGDADDDEEVHYDQYGRIIIVPKGDVFIPSNITTRIITKATRKLYDGPYAFWSDFSFALKEQIFNDFKSKCVWEHRYSADVAANFHLKARKRLSHCFSKARKLNQKPEWLLQNLWEDLQRQWLTAEFLEKSEKGKKARASEKGGSLHTGGAISLGTIKRRMEKKLGRPMNQDELFKETHIVKKKKETD